MTDNQTIEERFWSKVDIHSEDECWIWKGAMTSRKYGSFFYLGKMQPSHRISWMLHNNQIIPKTMYVCHSCDTPLCVNPKHLFLGTQKDNIQDCVKKGRVQRYNLSKTHCKFGHPFDEKNTYIRKNGSRECRKCDAIRMAKKRGNFTYVN